MGCKKLSYLDAERALEKSSLFVVDALEKKAPFAKRNIKAYPYGFQSQTRDDEISGSGNSYSAEFWQYDPRLGRRWNTDPIVFPHQSVYAAFNNNPIYFTDPMGLSGNPFQKLIHGIKVAFSKLTGGTTPVQTGGNKGKGSAKRNKKGNGGGRGNSQQRAFLPEISRLNKMPSLGHMFPENDMFRDPLNSSSDLTDPLTPDETPPPHFRISEKVTFQSRSDEFTDKDDALEKLMPIAEMLKNTPNVTIVIMGNVSSIPASGKNTLNGRLVDPPVLMNARGKKIQDALIGLGVNPSQVLYGPGRNLNNPTNKTPHVDFDLR